MQAPRPYQVCTRCVMDTSIPTIRFDASGVCQFCDMHDVMEAAYPLGTEGERRLEALVARIKKAGQGKPYDCVCGVSGGRDSTYLLYLAVKLGLRPLAVHFDNGWNSEIAVTNIQKATSKLNVDLETVVVDWEEFRDLLVSFLKASVPDVDVPTDVAIHSVLHKVAAAEGISFILNGHCFRTEGIAPIDWTYMDGRYIDDIRNRFATRPAKSFDNFGLKEYLYYSFVRKVEVEPLLNYVTYRHAEVQDLLERELDWQYYGGHHHESYYTRFVQSYLLPTKFNADRRRTELSALIRSGQTGRDEALSYLGQAPYAYDEELIDYVVAKLALSRPEFEAIMQEPPKSFRDYKSYYPMIRALRLPIWLAVQAGVVSKLLYLKFLG